MRLAFALVLATGCIQPHGEPPPSEPDPYDGWTGPDHGPITSGCRSNAECGTLVCARDGGCYPAGDVRYAHVAWTIDGGDANPTSCAGKPDLFIAFWANLADGSFGFAPVPCKNGEFFIDKLPTIYTRVELGTDGAISGVMANIDRVTGEAMLDLP